MHMPLGPCSMLLAGGPCGGLPGGPCGGLTGGPCGGLPGGPCGGLPGPCGPGMPPGMPHWAHYTSPDHMATGGALPPGAAQAAAAAAAPVPSKPLPPPPGAPPGTTTAHQAALEQLLKSQSSSSSGLAQMANHARGGTGLLQLPEPEPDLVEEALTEALQAVAHMEQQWSVDQMRSNVYRCLTKAIEKYRKDERVAMRGTAIQAQGLVEEFIEFSMGTCADKFNQREWFLVANFAGPLYAAIQQAFSGSKIFARVLTPSIQRFVEEGLFRFREERRIDKSFWEAICSAGLEEKYHKKAYQNLCKAYDSAHPGSPWGKSEATTPGQRLLEDFTSGWVRDFLQSSFGLLKDSLGEDRDEHIIFVTALFQTLVGPEMRAIPYEILQLFEEEKDLPPKSWDFIAHTADECGRGLGKQNDRKREVNWAHWEAPDERDGKRMRW